jgi:AcrR family transcriptional regulator
MYSSTPGRLTPKALLTRQRILDTALRLFAANGYDRTSMRDIAGAAGCSLGLAYRYFASKEDMVLELYLWLVARLEDQVRQLPEASIAERFRYLLSALLDEMAPHRLTLTALSGAALNPLSRAGVFGAEGAEVRHRARRAYVTLVAEAKDAPRSVHRESLATILYGVQLAMVLFWLQDLSSEARRTDELLEFSCGLLSRLRPLLRVPWIAQAIAHFVEITGPMLGYDGP